jgi:Ca2+-binding RTX toxin-like protein
MTGGTGNDTYYVDNTGDRVVETSTGGTADRVVTAISYTLGSYVENLAASGTAAVRLTGNTLKNVIAGTSASNIINGGAGSDTMIGGAGNDTYYVASTGDRVVETSTGGTADRVVTTISYKLGYYVEQLIAIGSGAVTLTGNSLSNMIIGNAAANKLYGGAGDDVLNGAAGADIMVGGTGNDIYYVASTGDRVIETSTGGTADSVVTTISYMLGSYMENLTAIGSAAVTLTGNSLSNTITGNAAANKLYGGAGNDVLNGAAGADIMTGGSGNDTYYVASTGDRVIETSTGGTADKVVTTISYTLGSYVEQLSALGTAAIALNGNTLKNVIRGNSGANKINGGLGNDTLYGGSGQDTFVFNTKLSSSNVDTIGDFVVAYDKIQLDSAIITKLGTATGTLNLEFFTTGTAAKDANDYIINNNGYLYYDQDGSGSGVAILFAKFNVGNFLSFSDFEVI